MVDMNMQPSNALVSLRNDTCLQAGRPPMGFLNPFLYQNSHAFTDITVGSNAIGRGKLLASAA